MPNVVERDTRLRRVLGFSIVDRDALVFIFGFGVERDDVPGVQQAGNVAEGAEEDVDQGVGGADARFDPNCKRTMIS